MKRGQWVPLECAAGVYGLGVADRDLVAVLGLLGIRVDFAGDGLVGPAAWVNDEADGALERMVGLLADLRWRYEEGRALQLALPGLNGGGGGVDALP